MALVGRQRPARALLGVESHRVEPAIVEPEALEQTGHVRRLRSQRLRPLALALEVEQPRQAALGGDHVSLDLDERDRGPKRRALLVEDAVPRALPPPVVEPGARPPAILEQAVAVDVAVLVDPPERGLDLRAQLAEEVERSRPVGVLAEQAQEQRRGVD